MTDRPQILPGALAEISSSAPTRLQKKLDKSPDAANNWKWQLADNAWHIAAGEEQVHLTANPVSSVDDVRCTCLLGPRCFHVLAVLSVLEITDASAPEAPPADDEAELTPTANGDFVNPAQAAAAQNMFDQCSAILAAGMRAAGTVLQSRLLRAIHTCRAEGLHRLSSAGLRIVQNIRLLRSNDDTFDSSATEADLLETLGVAWQLTRPNAIPTMALVGVARRRFTAVTSLKLHGLCCEPILTRSGYSGVVTYLIADDGWTCSVSDVQPGDATRISQAWKSGVSVASLAVSHRDLSRQCLLVSKATKSADGRLGGAESARAVIVEGTGWEAPPIAAAFAAPFQQQIERCFEQQTIPASERPAGSDFLFVRGTVLGCTDQELLLQQTPGNQLLRLAITIDTDALPFRDNLTLLARAPGLKIKCLGRMNFLSPGEIKLISITPDQPDEPNQNAPVLQLPTAMPFHADLGLDELQRVQFSTAERHPVDIPIQNDADVPIDDLLSRWLRAIALGGRHAVPSGTVTSAVRDAATLQRQLRPTAAGLLHSLTQAAISTQTDVLGIRFPPNAAPLGQYWLAAAKTSQVTDQQIQELRWLAHVADENPRTPSRS